MVVGLAGRVPSSRGLFREAFGEIAAFRRSRDTSSPRAYNSIERNGQLAFTSDAERTSLRDTQFPVKFLHNRLFNY